jgi:hypothetical protein
MKAMMNHSIWVTGRAWPATARTTTIVIATAALALLAAACGSGPSGTDPGSAQAAGSASASNPGGATAQLVAYSQCMRNHGVPSYPDPANGGLPKGSAQQFGVSTSQFQAAQSACQHLLPVAQNFQQQAQQCLQAGACPPALVQQMLTADRKFAQCMRSHGVPNWPDPTMDSLGRPVFNLTTVGITHSQTHSPPMSTKLAECQRLDPAPAAMESN